MDYIKVEAKDLKTITKMLRNGTDRKVIIHFIRDYIYNPK